MKKIYMLLFLMMCTLVSQAQAIGTYVFSQSTGTYTPITGGTNIASTSSSTLDDNVAGNLPIGFSFKYAGVTYTEFGYNANGWISLGTAVPSTNGSPISAGTTNNVISAFGTDLVGRQHCVSNRTSGSPTLTVTSGNPLNLTIGSIITGTGIPTGTTVTATTATTITMSANATSTGSGFHARIFDGGIRYQTIGTSPNRKLVVQFYNFSRYTTSTSNGDKINFQIVLNETTNAIDFIYGSPPPSTSGAIAVEVGLRGASGVFNNRSTTTNWSSTVAGTVSNATITYSSTVSPASGLTFTFTPPTQSGCTTPTALASALTFSSVTASSLSGSFTAASPAPSKYLVVRSTSATPPTPVNGTVYTVGATTLGTNTNVRLASNATTFTDSGLSASTTYYYYVFSYNDNCTGEPFYSSTALSGSKLTACAAATGLTLTKLTDTSVSVSWTGGSGIVEFGTSGCVAGTGNTAGACGTILTGTSPQTITGLASNTTYSVYVRLDCGSGNGFSTNISSNYTTPPACPANLGAGTVTINSVPYSISGQTTCGNGNNVTASNVSTIGSGSSNYYGGEDKTYIFSPAISGAYNILITTSADEDAGVTLYKGCPFSTGSTIVAFAQSTTGLTRTFSPVLTQGETYYLVVDNYPSPACVTSYSVAVSLVEIPVCVTGQVPANAAVNVARNLTLSWTAAANATSYDVYFGTDADPATFTNVTTTTFTPPTLAASTQYFWKVVPKNANGSATGCQVSSFTTGTDIVYCTPAYTGVGSANNNEITNVTVKNLNNTSGASASPFYTFYNNVTIPTLYRGLTETVSVSFGSQASQYVGVWIDFNQNGSFETGEYVLPATDFGSNGIANVSVPVPAGAVLGNTKMRIIGGKNSSSYSATDACSTALTQGEVEDYIVNISNAPAPVITGFANASVCVNGSFTVNGTNLSGAVASGVKVNGTPVASITSNNGTSIVAILGAGSTTGTVSVTTPSGTATSSDNLVINALPVISVQPTAPAAICATAGTASISVTSDASAFQWRRNGVPLTNTAPYSGVTSATLTITNPAQAEMGNFDVVVRNAAGCSVTSSAVIVTINAAPINATGVAICAGGAGSLSAGTCIGYVVNNSFTMANIPASGPTYTRSTGGTSYSASTSAVPYSTITIKPTVTGSYVINGCASGDTHMQLYSGTFNPASPAVNFIEANDDGNDTVCTGDPKITQTLTGGQEYVLVYTPFSASTAVTDISITVTPPTGGNMQTIGTGTPQWYTVANGGTPIGSGASFNPVGVANSGLTDTNTPGDYTFYAACSTNTACRTAVIFKINPANTYYADADNDGYGNASVTQVACTQPSGYVTVAGDCNDSNASVHPGAVEVYGDGIDNNCDGNIDTDAAPCSATTTWNGTVWTPFQPTASQHAVIAANYSEAVNLSACSLDVTGTAVVTIPSGYDFNITGVVNVASTASLTVSNDANLIQGADYTGTTSNDIGNIKVKRDVKMWRQDYVYWGAPVTGQNLKDFSPATLDTRFYVMNEATNAFTSVFGAAGLNQPVATYNFVPAKGYMVRAPNTFPNPSVQGAVPVTTFEGQFTGLPNNGTITTPVSNSGPGLGFNMIANPYPSVVNGTSFLTANPGTIYFWTHHDQVNGNNVNYASYNLSGGVAPQFPGAVTPDGSIAIGQGFMFLNQSASTAATFTNAMRSGNNTALFYRDGSNRSRIWVNLSNGQSALNQMMVNYMPGATLDVDNAFDGKLIDGGSAISSLIGNDKYVIQARPEFQPTDVVPMSFTANEAGTYTISIDHVDGLFSGDQDIFLQDLDLGVTHDLKASAYSFTAAPGSSTSRFQLVYQASPLANPTFDANHVVIYKENNVFNINSGKLDMAKVQIFDIRGRLIYTREDINANTTRLNDLRAEQGVLLVQITSTDGVMVTRKVVY